MVVLAILLLGVVLGVITHQPDPALPTLSTPNILGRDNTTGPSTASTANGSFQDNITVPSPASVPNVSLQDNTTAVPHLTDEEQLQQQLEQQWYKLKALPGCQVVNASVKVKKLVWRNSSDELLDRDIVTLDIPVARCQGFCAGNSCCVPTRTVNNTFVLEYVDKNDIIRSAKRQVNHHLECQCETAHRRSDRCFAQVYKEGSAECH